MSRGSRSTEAQINAPNTMQVAVRISWCVVVDDNIDTLDINTTAEDVGGDENTLLERLELLVASNAIDH